MSWKKALSFEIDVARAGGVPCLLTPGSSGLLQIVPSFVSSDHFRVQLYFREAGASPLQAPTSIDLESTDSIVMAAKPSSGMGAAAILFEATEFTKVVDGDDTYYWAMCNLNTDAVAAAFAAASGNSIPIVVDIEVEGENNADRLTFQFSATFRREAYDGSGSPAPIPGPSGLSRWKNGNLQFKDITTGLWHTYYDDGGVLKRQAGEE